MNIPQQITLGVMIGTAVFLISYDIAIIWLWGNSASISAVTRELGVYAPVLPLAFGILAGHLWGFVLVWPYVIGFVLGALVWGQGRDAKNRDWFRRP